MKGTEDVPRCSDCGAELPMDGRYEVTVMAEGVMLHGEIVGYEMLRGFADRIAPMIVVASPLDHEDAHEAHP